MMSDASVVLVGGAETCAVPGVRGLQEYLDAVEEHCLYTRPARVAGVLRFTHLRVQHARTLRELESFVFVAGLSAAERQLRARRQRRGRERELYSENLVFEFDMLPVEALACRRRIFDWPHWLLKFLYTPSGLLFGKFWVGEKDVSRVGAPLPVPPVDILTIRSAIPGRDKRFFSRAPWLLPSLYTQENDLHLPSWISEAIGEIRKAKIPTGEQITALARKVDMGAALEWANEQQRGGTKSSGTRDSSGN